MITYLPTGHFNLVSMPKLTKAGWQLHADLLWLTKDQNKIVFDIVIPSPKGMLYAMHLKCDTNIAGISADVKVKMTVQQAHSLLGHCNEEAMHKSTKALGWDLKPGDLQPCAACAAAKAKQKNVPKESLHVSASASNGRIYLDIATMKLLDSDVTMVDPNWCIMVDEWMQMKFSDFFQTKTAMVEPTCKNS